MLPQCSLSVFGIIFFVFGGAALLQTTIGTWYVLCFLSVVFCIWYYLLRVWRGGPVSDYDWNMVCTVLPQCSLSVFGVIFFVFGGAALLQTTIGTWYVLCFLGVVFLYLVLSSSCLGEPPCFKDVVWTTVSTVLPWWSLSEFGTIFFMSKGVELLQTRIGTRLVLCFLRGVFLYLVLSSLCLEEPPYYTSRLEHSKYCTSSGESFCILSPWYLAPLTNTTVHISASV